MNKDFEDNLIRSIINLKEDYSLDLDEVKDKEEINILKEEEPPKEEEKKEEDPKKEEESSKDEKESSREEKEEDSSPTDEKEETSEDEEEVDDKNNNSSNFSQINNIEKKEDPSLQDVDTSFQEMMQASTPQGVVLALGKYLKKVADDAKGV